MQALQALRAARAADAEQQRSPAVGPEPPRREPPSPLALFGGCPRQAVGELAIRGSALGPPLDASRGLEARDRGHEVWAREVVRRRKRAAFDVVRPLFRDGRPAEGAANGDSSERSRWPAELLLDELTVLLRHARPAYCAASARAGCP